MDLEGNLHGHGGEFHLYSLARSDIAWLAPDQP